MMYQYTKNIIAFCKTFYNFLLNKTIGFFLNIFQMELCMCVSVRERERKEKDDVEYELFVSFNIGVMDIQYRVFWLA